MLVSSVERAQQPVDLPGRSKNDSSASKHKTNYCYTPKKKSPNQQETGKFPTVVPAISRRAGKWLL